MELGDIRLALGGALGAIPLIGWGKPTPVNPNKWKNYKQANVMVSIAGILANLIIAIVAGLLGIGGVAVISKEIAWILFVVGLILAVITFVMGRRGP